MSVDVSFSKLTGLAVTSAEIDGQQLYLIRLGTNGDTRNYFVHQTGMEELRRQIEAALFASMIAGASD